MIIAQKQNDIVKSGFDNSKKATINQDKLAKLQHILTKGLYSDAQSAVIVEWTNNAVDSVVQAGKNPIECPVIVRITESKFSVEDKGIGLDREEFENVCMNYLTSTKETNNQTLGAFGLGMKSFMALDRSATFTCRKDGIERKFLAYQGEEFMEYDMLIEIPTDKENGVICEININGWDEFSQFRNKAKKKLAYYDTVLLYINDTLIQNNIIRSEDWQYSHLADNYKIHLCLKDVYYNIDWDKLGISSIDFPVALRFNLEDGLQPTPSRENLIWNSYTINLVKEKIKKVATWFVNKYNESVPEEQELLKVFKDINNNTKVVKLADNEFIINNLLQYSSVKPKELKIKGISVETPEYYYQKRNELLDEYETVVYLENATWRTKHIKGRHSWMKILDGIKHIEVDKVPTGLVKKYLLEKHGSRNLIFLKKTSTRKLGGRYVSIDSNCYKNILNLVMFPKDTWRSRIQEWQFVENEFKKLIINEVGIENTKEYQDWLLKHKEEQKQNKAKGYSSGNYKTLNKQEGDVTISYCIPKSVGSGFKFEKNTYKIAELHKNKYLTILFTEEEKEKALNLRNLQNKWKIAIIGKNEGKKIENIHNFVTFKQFMEKSKPFKRLMTSFLFEKEIEKYDNIFNRKDLEIIQNCLKPLYNDIQLLRSYVSKNGKYVRDNELLDQMIEVAKEYDLYDYEFWTEYQNVKNSLQKYEFITLLQSPSDWDEENTAKVKSLINQILLFRKKYYNTYEEFEIIIQPKEQPVVAVEEETILEEQLETV